MSNEPAFPIIGWKSPDGMYASEVQRGMTLRDYFAGQALQGAANHQQFSSRPAAIDEVAARAYYLADAMLKAREA